MLFFHFDHRHIGAYIVLLGCLLTVAGLVINVVAHTRAVVRRRLLFVTGQDVAGEVVWWLVNLGMLCMSVGIFWVVYFAFIVES